MQPTQEAVIVACLVVLSLSPVMVGLLAFPTQQPRDPLAPLCPWNPSPYDNSVNLTPLTPVLLPRLDQYSVGRGAIGFHLGSPADLSGAWNATAPITFGVENVSSAPCYNGPPQSISEVNGTFNFALFPGNYVIHLGWSFSGGTPTVTATQPWIATFDRGLDVLQTPEEIPLSSDGYSAWTVSAPNSASQFFVEYALVTDSCNFELAMLPPSTYRAFVSGQGPLNSNGTDVILSTHSPYGGQCGPSWGPADAWCETGPFNWTSRDVVVFFNEANYGVGLNLFTPLEVSYLTG